VGASAGAGRECMNILEGLLDPGLLSGGSGQGCWKEMLL
jgi:hypothetical protein